MSDLYTANAEVGGQGLLERKHIAQGRLVHFDLYFSFQEIKRSRRWKFMSNTAVIPHRSIYFARSHSNWGHITAARLRESGASNADEPGTRRRCARRVSRGLRRNTAVVIVMVRNGSCDTTAAATVQHCRRSSSQTPAPSLTLTGSRGTTAATVQCCGRSSSQALTPSLALAGSRGTTAATVQYCGRSSSKAPALSVALTGSRGTLAAMGRR